MNRNKHNISSTPLENPTPDYEAARVVFEDTSYENGKAVSAQTSTFDITTDVTPVEREISLEQLDREVHQIGKTAIETFMLRSDNTNEDNRKLFTVFMGWGGNAETDIARLELANIQAAHPDSDILLVNNPGSGESSPLERKTARELRRTGDFRAVGNLYAEILQPYIDKASEVTLYGHSEGALSAIGATAALHDRVDHLVAVDAPGSRKLGVIGLMKAFMMREGKHVQQYQEHSQNPYALEKQRENDANMVKNLRAMGWRGVKQQFIDHTIAMGKSNLEAQLTNAAESMKENGDITYVSPELSELSNQEAVSGILGRVSRLHQDNPAKYPRIHVSERVMKEATHAIVLTNPTLFQAWTKPAEWNTDT